MKKLAVMMVIAILGFVSTTKAQSAFDKFEDMDNVTSVVINQKAIELFARIDSDDPEAKQIMEMVKTIKSIRVFTTDKKNIALDLRNTVNGYLKKGNLEELMRVKDKDVNVKFYIKEGKDADHVSELLMYIDGFANVNIEGRKIESVLLSIVGDIDLNKISELTKSLNLPSELDKAQK
jgi:hypothetical protein